MTKHQGGKTQDPEFRRDRARLASAAAKSKRGATEERDDLIFSAFCILVLGWGATREQLNEIEPIFAAKGMSVFPPYRESRINWLAAATGLTPRRIRQIAESVKARKTSIF